MSKPLTAESIEKLRRTLKSWWDDIDEQEHITVIDTLCDLAKSGLARGSEAAPAVSPDAPLCDGHASAWFTNRNNLEGDIRCVACAFQPVPPLPVSTSPYQERVREFMVECFGASFFEHGLERDHRFLEEALELVQANGCSANDAHMLVDYVYGRPAGQPHQECGGVMTTLAAVCLSRGLDMMKAGEDELDRVWTKIDAIREKQRTKPKASPLPQASGSSAAQGWQPIATAPKDRNIILTDGKVVGEGGWMTDVEQGADYEGQNGMAGWWCIQNIPDGKPTHWQPLPDAPRPDRSKA